MGFKIKQIGKEFDLLKISQEGLLNIELKSQSVSKEEMRKQLLRNKYYLSCLGKRPKFITLSTADFSAYELDEQENLCEVDFQSVVDVLRLFGEQE